jgi:predicted ester cyclase
MITKPYKMSATINVESNKIIARNWLEFISKGDVDAICLITDPKWTMQGGLPGLPPGVEGVRKLFASFGSIEQQWTLEEDIAEGDKVVTRATNVCMQESFFGVPSHGRRQTFTATFIHQIADGKILKTWRNADDLGRVLQLGGTILPGR